MPRLIDPESRDSTWEEALGEASPVVVGALESALAGKEVTLEQGLALSVVRDDDFVALVKVADELRRRAVGDRITYVVNRNLNFTNVCIVGCSFCGFGRG